MSSCLFCKIVAGEIPAEKIYEDEEILAFNDISPQAPHHFLVIPKAHISSPAAVSEPDDRLVGKMIRVAAEITRKQKVEGYRLVFNNGPDGGQVVYHIHMHVLGGRQMQWPPG